MCAAVVERNDSADGGRTSHDPTLPPRPEPVAGDQASDRKGADRHAQPLEEILPGGGLRVSFREKVPVA